MVVATGAVEGQAHPEGAHGLGHVEDVLDPVLFGNASPFAVDHVVAVEPGGEDLLVGGAGQKVACELPDGKVVVGEVLVEGLDHPVPPGPHGTFAVALVSVGVGIAGRRQPVPGHALPVGGRGERAVDQPFPGPGLVVGEKGIDLLEGGGKPGQVEREAPDEGLALGPWGGLELFVLEPFFDQEVDGVDLLVFDLRTDDGLEGPVVCPLGPAGNPFLEQSDFLGA